MTQQNSSDAAAAAAAPRPVYVPESTDSGVSAVIIGGDLDQISAEVTALLTRVARARHSLVAAPQTAPAAGGGQLDFAAFLTTVLAQVTANVGGVEQLMGGRADTWQAQGVRQLLAVAGCHDHQTLAAHRTEPIVIEVSIARIAEEAGAFGAGEGGEKRWRPLLSPEQSFAGQYSALHDELDRELSRVDAITDSDEQVRAEAEVHARSEERYAAVRARWAARYSAYLDALRAAVNARAAELGIWVPIEVRGETDPVLAQRETADADALWARDGLAGQLYEHALNTAPIELLVGVTTATPAGGRP
ncbi:hypothetical protein [Nocardia thailandica]